VIAAVISTPFASNIIRLSLQLRRHPCGISGWDIPVFQSPLRFYRIFHSSVIKLMLTHVHLVVWASITVYLFLIQ
jgi:hypothetical protein